MPRKFGFAIAILMMSAAPAMAGVSVCGDLPVAPDLPSAKEIAQLPPAKAEAAKHQAYLDIVSWQKTVANYRNCLDAAQKEDKRASVDAQKSGGDDVDQRVTELNADIEQGNVRYNTSVTTEQQLAKDFGAISQAYCGRSDVDKASCPK